MYNPEFFCTWSLIKMIIFIFFALRAYIKWFYYNFSSIWLGYSYVMGISGLHPHQFSCSHMATEICFEFLFLCGNMVLNFVPSVTMCIFCLKVVIFLTPNIKIVRIDNRGCLYVRTWHIFKTEEFQSPRPLFCPVRYNGFLSKSNIQVKILYK